MSIRSAAGSVGEWVDGVKEADEEDVMSDQDWDEDDYPVPGSLYGDYDDEKYRRRFDAVEESVPEVDEDTVAIVTRVLGDVAARQQRLEVARLRQQYVRGRAHLDPYDVPPALVKQRLFIASQYTQIGDLNDAALYDKLKAGRVITRLSAPTGSGKTLRLPALIATRCAKRVCLVTLDANLAKDAVEWASREYNVKGSNRLWTRTQGAYVSALSYYDFRGVCMSNGIRRFFADFDVFIFDEPQVKTAVVNVARYCFACFARPESSLLLLSATVSTDAANDMTNTQIGRFLEEPEEGGFDALLKSNKLISQYCIDRTQVIVAHALKVYEVQAYYEDAGCDVRVLDPGSSRRDEADVRRWLAPASAAVPRILVTVREYGTGKNFPIAYVVTSCEGHIYEVCPDGSLADRYVPLEEVEVKQHMGRTGRGLAQGSGGILASRERADIPGDLMRCERLEAYLSLLACGIEPRNGFLGEESRLLPKKVTQQVARTVLSFALHPLLVLRCMGSDGKVAKRFSGALKLFLQRDHFLDVSRDVDPVGYSDWVEEKLGGYSGIDEELYDVSVMVPFPSPPTMRVVMHTIFAVAQGWLEVPDWRPDHSEDSDSESEDLGLRGKVRSKVKPVGLRLVTDEKPLPKIPVVRKPGWAFDADENAMASRRKRRGVNWSTDDVGQKVIRDIIHRAESGMSFDLPLHNVEHVEDDGKKMVRIKRPASIEVDSPGGSPIFTLSYPIFEQLMTGLAMTPGVFVTLLGVVRKLQEKFVRSTLFDSWGQPWLSVLRSCADSSCVSHACAHGLGPTVRKMVDRLYDRFRTETVDVCTTSNLYRKQVRGLWKAGISTTRLVKAIDKGRIPIAQSDKFLRRFCEIHKSYSTAIYCLESHGVFNPALVTKVQRPLPLRARDAGMPVLGGGVLPPFSDEGSAPWGK